MTGETDEAIVALAALRRGHLAVAGGKAAFRVPAGVNMFNPKKTGEYRLRIVPFTVGKGNPYADPGDYYYERTYKVHNYVGAAKEAFICAADCDKVPCAVCDYRNKLSGENVFSALSCCQINRPLSRTNLARIP